ncbi:MAG TPA: hemerythrin domain-containing protein [Albitalea sp.]|uniref:hemerythrin domain-containing protein n=1 Tax=Piscinibacter sp. TaxID=1903157 RepID=UPI002ED05070
MTAASLPFPTPAAGFDDPLAMLDACHDRVRRSLELLRRICERVEAGRVDADVRAAATDVLRYFDIAAPHHHEDEERHVFPAVTNAPEVIARLHDEHREMSALWAELRVPLSALAGGDATAFAAQAIALAARFRALYEQHAKTEEDLIFPAAAAELDAGALRRIGDEMATRRGATRFS